MKKKVLKTVVLSLLAVTMLVFSGCGKKNVTEERKINKDAIYRETELGIKFPQDADISAFEVCNNKLYAGTYSYVGDNTVQKIITCNLDGSDMKEIKLSDKDSYFDRLLPFEDGRILVFYSTYEEIITEDSYDYNNYYYAMLLDADGKELAKEDLSENIEYVSSIKVFNDQIYLFSDSKIVVLDMNLKVVKIKEFDTISIYRVYLLRNGNVIVSYWGEGNEGYKKLDLNTLEFGDDIDLGINVYTFDVSEGIDYDLMLKDSTSVYGFNIGDTEPKLLLNFVDSDIETAWFSSFTSIDNGSFIGTYYSYDDTVDDNQSAYKVFRYDKVNPEEVVEKEVITLGCLYLDDSVKKQVIKFNKTNEKYRIRITDYSIYSTEEDWEAGSKKFNSDIAAGKGPDIVISSDSSSIHNYITKGLYADLSKYLENDPEINKDDIFPNLLKMGSVDGKLYEIIPYFYIQTVIGKKSILGDKEGWTMKEMMEFEKTIPETSKLFMGMSRDEFLDNMLTINSDQYINMATGKCNFDSEDFRGVLEYAKKLPEINDDYYNQLEEEGYWENYETLWISNKAVLMPTAIYNLRDYNLILKGYMGEDITFIGYPSEDRKGSSAYYYFSLGISSKCKAPESAWEFVRTYLLSDYQKSVSQGVPASMSAFDELGKKAMERETYNDGEALVYAEDIFYVGGQQVNIKPLTAEEIAKYKQFILSVEKVQGSLSDVETIIDEETQGYFLGDKSLEDVVKNVQGRVQLFVNEKR